jgi:hypothetical protein
MLERFPVIGDLVRIPVVRSLLVGVLPGLALRIFVLLLPVLLYALNRRSGAVGQADMDGHVSSLFASWVFWGEQAMQHNLVLCQRLLFFDAH